MSSLLHKIAVSAAVLVLSGLGAHAQGAPAVPISGAIHDGAGGPLLSGVVYTASSLSVPSNQTLSVEPGAIVKFTSPQEQFAVHGTLLVSGGAANPSVFTSIYDDAHGGDTDGGGPSVGTPGDWQGITFQINSDASVLDHAEVLYAGTGGSVTWPAAVSLSSADVTLRNCRIADGSYAALALSSGTNAPTISDCVFEDNVGGPAGNYPAVMRLPFQAIAGFSKNTASGNGGGDYMKLYFTNIDTDLTIGPDNLLGGVLVLAGIDVPNHRTLTLEAGTVFKVTPSGNGGIRAIGALNLLGTAAHPVVFTSIDDDTIAGDTNNNGSATTPSAGQWGGIEYTTFPSSTTAPSVAENVLIRYGRTGFLTQNDRISARSVRAEHMASFGFRLRGISRAVNLVAFDCGVVGIFLERGTILVEHATVTGNAQWGVRKSGPNPAMTAINTISWNNPSGNFSNFTPAELTACNGDPAAVGINNNINVDPLFVDASVSVGDLHLQSTSPCLNRGDWNGGVAAVKDHDENSRILDHDLSGAALPDMGAYERVVWTMSVTGEPRTGDTLSMVVPAGTTPAVSIFMLGFLDAELLFPPYGFVLAGRQTIFFLATVPSGVPVNLKIPKGASLVGFEFGLQTGTFSAVDPSFGNTTNLYRAKVRR